MLYLLVAAFLLVSTHAGVRRVVRYPEWARSARLASLVGIVVGAVLTVAGLWVVWHKGALDEFKVERPWVLATGVILLGYGPWLLMEIDPEHRSNRVVPDVWRRHSSLLVVFVVVVCTFWSFSAYAAKIGGAESRDLVDRKLTDLPLVIVYSAKDLDLRADGVESAQIGKPDAAYRWRYSGLRLLVFSNDKYFLLPAQWDHRTDVAIVLEDAETLRVEYQRKDAKP